MARMFWKGSISFGLVEIPVGLRTAVRPDDLDFTLLDKKGFSPIGYRRYNKATGREVPHERTVRGYEFEPDQYVILGDEELRAANVRATRAIEIVQFVERHEIAPLFFETPYYVEPLKKDSKSYALLREVLRRTGRIGVARVVLKTRQHVAALLVHDGALVLELMRYPHELVAADELQLPKGLAGVSEAEMKMATRLVESMAARWDPGAFRDDYRDDVLALVRRKVESGKIHTILEPAAGTKEPRPRADVVDLMPLLKQSLSRSPAKEEMQPARHADRRRRAPAARRRTARAESGGRATHRRRARRRASA